MNGLTACLWFDDQAEEAARYYASIFKNSRVGRISHYGPSAAAASGQPAGSVLTVEFEVAGQKMLGLNGGPQFKFSEAVSLMVNCDSQQEIDAYWDKLTADGGSPGPCGWLKDKFGFSWQIVPAALAEMTADPDPEKSERVMAALLDMTKLDLATLQQAYRGEAAYSATKQE